MRGAALLVVMGLLVLGCSVDDPEASTGGDPPQDRTPWKPGKADSTATCLEKCGEQAEAGCWCDDGCITYGDCCPDKVTMCGGPGPDKTMTCDVSCSWVGDCPANEPYCNMETGKCQQLPPQCVTDFDCEGDQEFCHPSGYCYMVPPANCIPGWVFFEGACDNPACPDETHCPVDTNLDPETCLCVPTVPAPACSWVGDCIPAYPYCNQETGMCQQEPPQCVTHFDCEGDQEYCHPSGYCYMAPPANCRPGWVFFEGACDNPGCPDETHCPADSTLDTETCLCVPICK